MATATNDKPVRLGDLPVVKTNILENARQYDKGVVGGYNGTFPLTAASQGGIYLLPSTGKFYVCETAYNGAQISAPNSNFVELSVWKNHDRLTNLIKSKVLTSEEYVDNNTKGIREFTFNNIPKEYNIISALSLDSVGLAQENITVNVDSSNKIVYITSCFLIFNESQKQHKIIIFYI